MKWITRERPKIDRIACPWLIRKYIDADAEFIFVPSDKVLEIAHLQGATPFDIPDVELSHRGKYCTFDTILKKYKLNDPALKIMAPIIRGADTDRHDFSPYSAGLWAISSGLSHNILNDYQLLVQGMVIYDALYSWASHLQKTKHVQSSVERILVGLSAEGNLVNENTPNWVLDLKHLLQDYIDADLSFSLSDISRELDLNPTYLSREFPKYFDNMSYGEYIRKLRVEKAKDLLVNTNYKLTQIAYLSGFSDQSHFTKIFKEIMGESPSNYRKIAKK